MKRDVQGGYVYVFDVLRCFKMFFLFLLVGWFVCNVVYTTRDVYLPTEPIYLPTYSFEFIPIAYVSLTHFSHRTIPENTNEVTRVKIILGAIIRWKWHMRAGGFFLVWSKRGGGNTRSAYMFVEMEQMDAIRKCWGEKGRENDTW